MWVFTKNGFYSVCANKDNRELMHVRAQFREDIEHLRSVISRTYVPEEMQETPLGDYRFRVNVTRSAWNYFVEKESESVDYTKFKPAVKDKSDIRKESYLAVFNEMMRAGREVAYEEYLENEDKLSKMKKGR